MENRRQHKMASLLQQTMGDILLKDARSHVGASVLVSITKVKTSPDLSLARYYLSVFGSDEPQSIVDLLNGSSYEWRKKLGAELKNHLRIIPQIEFFLDDTLEYAQKMNELFDKLKEEDKGDKNE
jgi:ribosome-binding factor A